jgi:HSP20 family molecular chaperone IbpA
LATLGTVSRVEKRRDLETAADEIEQLFADLWQVFPFSRGARRGYRPNVDFFRTDDPPAFTVLVELPGVDPEHVKLVAAPRALVIAGERRRPQDCGHYQQMEIEYGPFHRKVVFGEDVDPDAATATYRRGVLHVTLPVAPKPSPRESVTIVVRTSR